MSGEQFQGFADGLEMSAGEFSEDQKRKEQAELAALAQHKKHDTRSCAVRCEGLLTRHTNGAVRGMLLPTG